MLNIGSAAEMSVWASTVTVHKGAKDLKRTLRGSAQKLEWVGIK